MLSESGSDEPCPPIIALFEPKLDHSMNKKTQTWINIAFVVFLLVFVFLVFFARKNVRKVRDKVEAYEKEIKSLEAQLKDCQ